MSWRKTNHSRVQTNPYVWHQSIHGLKFFRFQPFSQATRYNVSMADTNNDISGVVFGNAVQAGKIGKVVLPPPVPLAVDGLPAETPEFTGRAVELAGLLDILGSTTNPVAVTAISGVAGVGKTSLALHAGHRISSRFLGGTLFVDLRGYDQAKVEPADALATFLRSLGVRSEHIPEELPARAALYRSVLRQRDPMLIIIDNAGSTQQVRPLLPGLPHRVLITSRHTLADLPGARQVDLDVMPTQDAVAMIDTVLRTRRPDDQRVAADPQSTAELAGLCGSLPLALGIVAAILADDPGQPVAELTAALRETPNRLDDLRYGDTPGLDATFDLSYARLTSDEQRMFGLVALNPSPVFSTAAAAALADLPERETQRLLTSLRRAHMIEAAEPRGRFRIHDLLRSYALTLIRPSEFFMAAFGRLCGYFLSTAASAGSHVAAQVNDDMRARFPDWHAADTWLEAAWLAKFPDHEESVNWIRSERDSLVNIASLASQSESLSMIRVAAPLAQLLLPYCMTWGDWDLALDLGRAALHDAERADDWEEQLAILAWLKNIVAFRSAEGFVRNLLLPQTSVDGEGPRQIADLTEDLRRIRSKRLPYDEVATQVELAYAHCTNQDYAATRRWALKAAALCRTLDLRLFLAHSNALAGVAASAVGRHAVARDHLGQARDGYREFRVEDLADAVSRLLADQSLIIRG